MHSSSPEDHEFSIFSSTSWRKRRRRPLRRHSDVSRRLPRLRELGMKASRGNCSSTSGAHADRDEGGQTCCGSARFPRQVPHDFTAMGEVKCASLLETGADCVVSNDRLLMQSRACSSARQPDPLPAPGGNLARHDSFAQDFKNAAARVTADLRHRGLIQRALHIRSQARTSSRAATKNWGEARQALEIKWSDQSPRQISPGIHHQTRAAARASMSPDGQQARDYFLAWRRNNVRTSSIEEHDGRGDRPQ